MLKVAKGGKENRESLMAAALPALNSCQIARAKSRISFYRKCKLLWGNVDSREALKNKISRTCNLLLGAHCVYSH